MKTAQNNISLIRMLAVVFVSALAAIPFYLFDSARTQTP